ncbi:restriction endonuclease [Tenacibaculum soleae]|uniref:Restriction endonuclease n=1 Tax=Tenacibaculum soleae TaxID=447689 RepID=A0A1B9Y266_9FLAO|nr:DEAD/DEAH box helicase family protein [Tenacibaculum soleae]OCK43880.1 restriction endonuclease [Tenacibaculum soleae]
MTNFNFLKEEFPQLYQEAVKAEQYTFKEPKFGALQCRTVLELGVKWLYNNDTEFTMPYDTNLSSLMHHHSFKNSVRPSMFTELNLVRKIGNNAAHGKKVANRQSLATLKAIFSFCVYISKFYSKNDPKISVFEEAIIPLPTNQTAKITTKEFEQKVNEAAAITKKYQEEHEKQKELAKKNELLQQQLQRLEAALQERKTARITTVNLTEDIPQLTPEAETRKLYIDVLLEEAGWKNLQNGKDIEYAVTGMPISTNKSGKGYADYVLWGNNGLPLAVIEAKSTLQEVSKGKHQAKLYADCLEQMHGQRPIIFYTNGYETFIWDDTFYHPREIDGFYTKEELAYLIFQRANREDIRNFKVDTAIAGGNGRVYQLEAVQRVAEALVTTNTNGNLTGKNREALLVMATGSGKTRTACAIIDMLTKNKWAKRVLFLADRNALVKQAKNAFKEHLPHLSGIDLTQEKEDNGTRLVFSTYPTIMNKIDALKNEDGRFYGVGHFDVIIIDEAHRSVYQKYQAIFDYFDAILIGLTATPKKELDYNTYGLFNIEDDNPTFAYELNDAVKQGFLNPPKSYKVPVKFVREGIKYSDLSEKDKAKFEEKFGIQSDSELDVTIDKSSINKFYFNTKTVDVVLDYLMTHGLKVNGGNTIGKTIIFAKNHQHAVFIEKRFYKNYPQYSSHFLRVIDNYESKAQDLLEKFCDDKETLLPQIAVSVDMMDTGVDAPSVLNLVFFKEVKSYAKYWQMVGRGTRLRPNIFAPGKDKEFFLIFDICKNIEFFEANPEGYKSSAQKSITSQVFEAKLNLIMAIRNYHDASKEDDVLAKQYTNELHTSVVNLNPERFEVRKVQATVTKYQHKNAWDNLSVGDISEIITDLSALTNNINTNEIELRFELLMLRFQLALLQQTKAQEKYIGKILDIGNQLYRKRNIPTIAAKITTINNITDVDYWKTVDVATLESIKEELKELIKFLDKDKAKIVYTDFEDVLDSANVEEVDILENYTKLQPYKDRITTFIRKNKSHLVIDKLHKNIPITVAELALLESFIYEETNSTKDQYTNEFGGVSLGKFIRNIIGLDATVANEEFANFVNSKNLNSSQITFITILIDFLTKNGTIDKGLLVKAPFNKSHDNGILGIFENDTSKITKIVSIIDQINVNAG